MMSESKLPNSTAKKRGLCYAQVRSMSPGNGTELCGYPQHLHEDAGSIAAIRTHEFVPWEGSDYQAAVGDRRDGRDPKHNRRATDRAHDGVCCCGKPTPCGMTHVQAEVIAARATEQAFREPTLATEFDFDNGRKVHWTPNGLIVDGEITESDKEWADAVIEAKQNGDMR